MTGDTNNGHRDGQYCGGKKRQGEGTCTQPAGWGTDHPGYGTCKLHAGSAPSNTLHAEKLRANDEARRALAQLDVAPVDDPLAALLKLAGQVVAWQTATAGLLDDLTAVRYQSMQGGEQLRAEVALYERAMDRAAAVLAAIARLNIEDRLAKVTERQADAVIAAIDAALAEAGITGRDAARAKQAAARHLRAA